MAEKEIADRKYGIWGWVVLAVAFFVAVISARDFAGSWNDGSRLATVESLVDRHTLVIDDSVFVRVPTAAGSPSPYPRDDRLLQDGGTGDKLLIEGRYYSDKPPVQALLMAGIYQLLQWATGLKAASDPGRFCYWMTLLSSGLAYVAAVGCVFRIGRSAGLAELQSLALALSLAFSTTALTYARQVNGHILLLAVAAALIPMLQRLQAGAGPEAPAARPLPMLQAGTLVGLGYTLDPVTGTLLFGGSAGLLLFRTRGAQAQTLFLLAAGPWILLHHLVNYRVGGTLLPANSVPAYMNWPGSSFNLGNMTGVWHHESFGHFAAYAAGMLVGKRGFLGHDLPLFLAAAGAVLLLRRLLVERPLLLVLAGWSLATGLIYALASNNYSGVCASIRWFVPLLAAGYWVLAVLLRRYPEYWMDFGVLSAWGAVAGILMWWEGPWMKHMVPGYWFLQGAAALSWMACAWLRRRNRLALLTHNIFGSSF